MVTLATLRRAASPSALYLSLACVCALGARSAHAEAPKPAAYEATLHHAPPTAATAHVTLRIAASIDYPQAIKRALLVYRTATTKEFREVPFLRASDGYVAEIPADEVLAPSLAYTIELEKEGGARVSVYASRTDPHLVDVPVDLDDQREAALDRQLHGRRNVVETHAEFVSFGRSKTAGGDTLLDDYFRVESSYTYRPLRTVVEFGIRAGAVRGHSPVPHAPGEPVPDPGLNYGAPFVVFRLTDALHLETHFLTSVTEVGFSTGIGGDLRIGDPYGTKLVFGVETVKTFGTRAWAQLDLVRGRFRVSPIVEVTDAPHADRAGVRLLTELGLELAQGFCIALRGGYQARDFNSGGPGFGASLAYGF